MKQIVTIFRAEGPQAARLIRLCERTKKKELFGLRESLRLQARDTARLTAYVELLDGWSMGDDFTRVLGGAARERYGSHGVLYFVTVTAAMLACLKRLAKRKRQFKEQAFFLRIIKDLALGCGACEQPVALAVFREIAGQSITDEEMKESSNQRFHYTRALRADNEARRYT